MNSLDTIVIGAGQAGLAMSRHLTALGLDHVVLERGRVAERWRSERWDSLRLLTPNWMTRLPGYRYRGNDPDGFMTNVELIRLLERYGRAIAAPVIEDARVVALEARGTSYRAVTARGVFQARTVVVATGACDTPLVPPIAQEFGSDILQLVPSDYRRPESLPGGGVLVVGASASGAQIADEIRRSGRPVTLAAGRHTRLPRTYRNHDIVWWLDQVGVFSERYKEVPDIEAARRQPSLQLIGTPERRSLGLVELAANGVRVVGRLAGIDGHSVRFATDLAGHAAAADQNLARLLDRIDNHIVRNGIDDVSALADRPAPQKIGSDVTALDLRREGIETLIWATGYRRDYTWLKVPVLDAHGEIRHDGGISPRPGLYVLGLRFMRRRSSNFIDGVGADAADLSAHIAVFLTRTPV
jgi:putative flavoprotein involved in K+ transport